MIGSYFDNPGKDLDKYLQRKGINSDSINEIGNREDNEDEWEIVGTFIASYINKVISSEAFREVAGGNLDLSEEVSEIFDANDLLSDDSENILYLDFKIISSDVLSELESNKESVISLLSVYNIDEDIKLELEKKYGKVHIIIK